MTSFESLPLCFLSAHPQPTDAATPLSGGMCFEEEMPGEEDWEVEDPPEGGEGGDGSNGDGDTKNENKDDPDSDTDTTLSDRERGLQTALAAERKKKQEAEAELKRLKDAEAERARKKAEQDGEFERLYKEEKDRAEEAAEKLSQLEQREADRVEALNKRNTANLKALPASHRALVPGGLSADETAAQIERVAAMAGVSLKRPAGTRTRGEGGNKKSAIPADVKAQVEREAQKYGYRNAETYYQKVYLPRQRRKERKGA
ncbi:MAG: hypothetical protein AAFV53_16515 [Myxococcota bacterium]